ncbi:pilin [Patescibacteria group bacterium]|nr:pilin [Patescibacteria group bacterium]MBU4056915.1 pilin [Patescibacteria group bacterium]MBU4369051.1 pilin [Patescibacteria group bacterium]
MNSAKIKNLTKKLIPVFSVAFLFVAYNAGATLNSVNFDNPTTTNTTEELVSSIVSWLLGITSAVVIIFLVYGGIMYITASGDENQIEKSKKIINYAIIGLFLVLISYSVVTTLNNIIFGP